MQVMIAEPRSRRKGVASEALIMFMLYAIAELVSWLQDDQEHHRMCLRYSWLLARPRSIVDLECGAENALSAWESCLLALDLLLSFGTCQMQIVSSFLIVQT